MWEKQIFLWVKGTFLWGTFVSGTCIFLLGNTCSGGSNAPFCGGNRPSLLEMHLSVAWGNPESYEGTHLPRQETHLPVREMNVPVGELMFLGEMYLPVGELTFLLWKYTFLWENPSTCEGTLLSLAKSSSFRGNTPFGWGTTPSCAGILPVCVKCSFL